MARLTGTGIEVLYDDLRKLGAMADVVAVELVKAGGDVLVDEWKRAAGAHVRTGEMRDSIVATNPRTEDWAAYVDVTFKGKDSHGVSNGQKAFILNYGNSHITADHWIDNANEEAKPKVSMAMREIFAKRLKGE